MVIGEKTSSIEVIKQSSRPTIGLLIENTSGKGAWYQTAIWAGVSDTAKQMDVNLLSFAGGALESSPFNEFESQRNALYDLVTKSCVDGLIVSGSLATYATPEKFKEFCNHYRAIFPVISIAAPLSTIPSILVDNKRDIYQAVHHLVMEHNRRSIAFIHGPHENPEAKQRFEAYQQALAQCNISFDPALVVHGNFEYESGGRAIDILLDQRNVAVDAVIAANDYMALGALEQLKKRGKNVPEEIAIIGFDGVEESKVSTPSLTTILQPVHLQGKRAVEMLLALLAGQELPDQEIFLPTTFVIRQSCGCSDSLVAETKTDSAPSAGQSFKAGFNAHGKQALGEIIHTSEDFPSESRANLTSPLLEAISVEIKGNLPGTFLKELECLLQQVNREDCDAAVWQDAISALHQQLRGWNIPEKMLLRAENLCQQARVMIGDAAIRWQTRQWIEAEQQSQALREISAMLVTTVQVKDLLDVIVRELPRLGIPACYVSLYQPSSNSRLGTRALTEFSELILAYNETGRIALRPEQQIFLSDQLIPEGLPLSEKRRSLVVVPLHFREEQLGFGLFEMGPRNGVIYEALRGQMSSALKGARLVQEVQKGQQRLHLLYEASNAITSLQDPQKILQGVIDKMCAAVGAWYATIVEVDEKGRPVRLTPQDHEPVDTESLVRSSGFAIEVIRSGEKILIDDVWRHARRINSQPSEKGQLGKEIRAVGCFPLRLRETPIGVIWVYYQEPHHFSEAEIDALQLYVNQAAIAYDNARMFQETRRREQLLSALDQASRHIRAEKETSKILPAIVRLAAQLVDCIAGALFVNRAHLEELELQATYGIVMESGGSRVSHTDGLIGLVAKTGKPQIVRHAQWPEGEIVFQSFASAVGVPIKQAGEVEAVLLVANNAGARELTPTDSDILVRFAAQTAIALQTSRLINREQRIFGQLGILHVVSDYIQAARDLNKILHAVLTGVTAGYGLGFNRAALLLFDEHHENLIGRMGIGQLREQDAEQDWAQHHARGLEDFREYLTLLEQDRIPPTPIGEKIVAVRLRTTLTEGGLFLQAMQKQHCLLVTQNDLNKLPEILIRVIEPVESVVLAPLVARNQSIGILIADNKFTRAPITEEDQEALMTFANTAAVAIDNAQLFLEAQSGQEKLRSFYQASNALVSSQDPGRVLHDIVEQARVAAKAVWVSAILVDETGRARDLATVGTGMQLSAEAIRPDGVSVQSMRTGQPEIIEDTSKRTKRVNPYLLKSGVAAALCLPLAVEGEPFGVMWFYYDKPRRFSTSEIEAAQLYVNQAAIAYDSARRIKESDHMRQAADALAGAASLPEVLEQIVRSAREVLQADSAAIWSYDDTRDEFIPEKSVSSGIPAELWEKFRQEEPRRGRTAYTVMDQDWVAINDVSDTMHYSFLGESTRLLLDQTGVQSFQGIALTVANEKLGVLYVNFNSLRTFHEKEQAIIRTFANHAALALKKARLLEQLSRSQHASRIVAQFTALGNREATLMSVAQGVKETVGCDVVTLYVYDESATKLEHPPTVVGARYKERASLSGEVLPDSIVYMMLQRSSPYIVEAIDQNELFKDRRFAKDEEIKSCVTIPLQGGRHKVGVMFVNYRSPHHFTEDELTNIQLFANQAAVAIQNAQLYDETTERAKTLRTLYEAGKTVTSSLTLDKILNSIVKQALSLATPRSQEGHFSYLALVESQRMRIVAATDPQLLAESQERLGEIDLGKDSLIGILGRVAKDGRSRNMGNVLLDPDYIEIKANTRSQLAVPIKIGDQVIGVISVEHPEIYSFDQEDQQALEHLADQAAIAIQNARQYEALMQAQGLIGARTALAWMGMASSTWRHTIDKHALTIREQAQLLRQDLGRTRPHSAETKLVERLATMERLATQILEKPITPPLSTETGLESVSLNALVGERARQLWQNDPYRQVELRLDLQLPGSITVRASSEWLRRAFDILVDNAVNAVNSREVRIISVGTRLVAGGAEAFVSDTGPGIPTDIRAKLGREWIDKPEGTKGLGMGLLMAQTIVQAYTGEIRVSSTGPTGTTMVIWLPAEREG